MIHHCVENLMKFFLAHALNDINVHKQRVVLLFKDYMRCFILFYHFLNFDLEEEKI